MQLSRNLLNINANNFAFMQTDNEQHRGARLEKALRSKNVNFTWLGKQINYDRNSFYLWFKREELEWPLIRLVVGALPWVEAYFPEMPVEISAFNDPQLPYGEVELKKRLVVCQQALSEKDKKYTELLEKYMKVIEERKA